MNDTDFSAALASLQAAGAAQRDPIGFHHMGLLAQRLQNQPEAVQRILASRLREAMARATQALDAAPAQSQPGSRTAAQAKPSPLGALNRHIQDVSAAPPMAETSVEAAGLPRGASVATPPALKSLDRFRNTWAKVATDAQLQQALARAPDNAGPLNSHLLVLRTLGTLNELSPEYLRGLMAQLDALQWLEQVTQKPTQKPALKPAAKAAPKAAPKASATRRASATK